MAIGKLTLLHWADVLTNPKKDWRKEFTRSDLRRMLAEIIRLRSRIALTGTIVHVKRKPTRFEKLGKLVDGMD